MMTTGDNNLNPLLVAWKLTIGYRDGSRTIAVAGPATLSLRRAGMTLLLGGNGAGKSTLLRTLSGILPPLSGTVEIEGRDIAGMKPSHLSCMMALVYTDRTLAGALTVREAVALGRHPHTGFFGRLGRDDAEIVDNAIETMRIGDLSQRYMATLSDGERQKTMIARALAQQTPLILLDEPTAFLDVPSRLETMVMLKQLATEQGKSVLLSTHDTGEALTMADDAWLIGSDGSVCGGEIDSLIADGSLDRLFADRGVRFDRDARDFRFQI